MWGKYMETKKKEDRKLLGSQIEDRILEYIEKKPLAVGMSRKCHETGIFSESPAISSKDLTTAAPNRMICQLM